MTDWDDRAPRQSWWADALDPVENLRVLADARQFGRRAAEELADRVLVVGPAANGRGDGAAGADLDSLARRFRADSVRAAELLADLIDGGAALFGELAGRWPGFEPNRGESSPEIHPPPVSPGDVATAVFWVHNSSAAPVRDVRPHCAPLRSHVGDELEAAAVVFDPPVLDPLPARSRCGIEVRVTVPSDRPPATYATIVFVTNVPDMHLPMRIDVVSEPAVP
jgi:hypothetical protein